MRLPPQNLTSKGCGWAHSQPHVSPDAAGFFPTSSSGHDNLINQSGLNVQPSSHENLPPYPPCYTQFTIVTCCCFFNQCIVCEGKTSLTLPSPTSCGLEDTPHYQQLHRDSDCPVLRLAPSTTGEIAFPSWSSGLHICVDTGTCKRRCCTRSHFGKRIFLAARRKLARFGLGQRRSVHFQSTSPTSTEHRAQSSTEHFFTHDSTSRIGLPEYLPHEADSGTRWELPTRQVSAEFPSELSSEGYVPPEPVSILESRVPTIAMPSSSTEEFLAHDSTPRIELPGYLPPKADAGMSWELPTRQVNYASAGFPAELSSERYVPHEQVSILESRRPTTALLPHFAPSKIPALCRPRLQASISTLDASFSDVHCPRSASESQYPLDGTINEDLEELGNEEDDVDHIRSLYDNVEQGPASQAGAEDRNFSTREMNILAGPVEFCESPTSISSGMEVQRVGLKINPCPATFGAFAESTVLASRQASCTSNGYTVESPVDLYLHRQPCHGILELQPQLSSPSSQYSVPSESSSSDRSASIYDCLYSQNLTLLRGPSSSELLEILNFEAGKLGGLMPSGLLEGMGGAFELTTEQSLGKLNELKEPEFRAVVDSVHRIKPTLDTGLSALNSLVIGQVPYRLHEVMSLLFIAYSIVTMLVDEQNRAQFIEALFLDDIEWMNAIGCREEQDAFEMLLRYVWMPASISSVCTHGHRWSSRAWRSFRPTRTPFERTYIPLEEGWLDRETESGFRLRTGLNAQVCQWYIDCKCRPWPSMNAALTWTQISIGQTPFIAAVNPIHLPATG